MPEQEKHFESNESNPGVVHSDEEIRNLSAKIETLKNFDELAADLANWPEA